MDVLQGDTTERAIKDLDVMLGAESAALILDDTAGVWPRHTANLLHVPRYVFFPVDQGRFGLPGSALLERASDEVPEAGLTPQLEVRLECWMLQRIVRA